MAADAGTWAVNPDVITAAIRVLAWVVGSLLAALGTALVGTLLYIWNKFTGKIDSIDEKVDRIATGLEGLTLETKTQIAQINIRCDERHTQRRRTDDL